LWNHVSPWFESLFLFSNCNFGFVFLFINLFGYDYRVGIHKKRVRRRAVLGKYRSEWHKQKNEWDCDIPRGGGRKE
jgi:hypothetical protein